MKQYLDMQKDLEIQNEVKTITTTRTTKVETETEAVDSVKKTLYKIEESGQHIMNTLLMSKCPFQSTSAAMTFIQFVCVV